MTIDFDDLKGCPLAKLNLHIHMCIYVYNWVVQKIWLQLDNGLAKQE